MFCKGGDMKQINEKNFAQETASGRVLVDFFATWCGPCRMQTVVLEEVAAEHPEISIVKVDVDENPALARKFGIMSIPTLVLLEDGELAKKHVGLMQNEDLINFYNSK